VKADIFGLLNGIKGISVGIAKRALVRRSRRVSDKYINRLMDARIDLDLLFPKTLREAFAKIWRKAYTIISK
jgi:hypothetical protein